MTPGTPRQKDVFLTGEGDASHRRRIARAQTTPPGDNPGGWLAEDPIGVVVLGLGMQPKRILEIGSRSGDRLAAMRDHMAPDRIAGIEPSQQAIESARERYPDLELHRGTAESLPFFDNAFDMVIANLCLSLCDPADLFRIAAEVDRVLQMGGHLVIYDYWPDAPHRRPYRYRDGVYLNKMDYGEMFRWHAGYQPTHVELFAYRPDRLEELEDRVAVQVLHRSPMRLPLVD